MLPDYKNSILNLASYIQLSIGVKPRHCPIIMPRPQKNVILLVIDGLGYNFLMKHGGFLKKHCVTKITSVFPSTTATALTTLYTGLSPAEHGLTGWYMYFRELGGVLAPLPMIMRNKAIIEADITKIFLGGHIADGSKYRKFLIHPVDYSDSDYTRAIAGKSDRLAYSTLAGMFRQIRNAMRSRGRKFIFSYWPALDGMFHEFGDTVGVREHLFEIEKYCSRLNFQDTTVIITADHGMIETKRSREVQLSRHPHLDECLRLPICGERRLSYLYVKPGKSRELEKYISKIPCRLHKSEKILRFFGPGKAYPKLHDRIGDYVVEMDDNYILTDSLLDEHRRFHIGNHGGTSEDEMWVPLIINNGQ